MSKTNDYIKVAGSIIGIALAADTILNDARVIRSALKAIKRKNG